MGLSSYGQNTDSLKLALKNAKHDTTRCNILWVLAKTASDEELPAFNEQLKVLAEKNIASNSEPKKFYLRYLASTINNIGYLAYMKGDMSNALVSYQKSLKIREGIGYKKVIASSLHNIGDVYRNLGDIPKALEYYNKSLMICEEIGDKIGVGLALLRFGDVYANQGDVTKAFEYYNKSLKIFEENDDKKQVLITLNSIGANYYNNGDLTNALEAFNKSLKINEDLGDKQLMAYFLNNSGIIYRDQGEISKALEYHKKALEIQEEIMDKMGIAYSLNNVAIDFLRKGQLKEAMEFANKGMTIAKEIGFPENINNSAGTLKTIFQKQNKYKEAFEMFELEVKMRDSIKNEETQKAAVKKQMQYQYETQARELKNEQDKKDIIAKAELQQREKERNYFIIGFALVIVLSGFIFRGYRQKQKANILIAQQKHEVEESRKEILDSIHYAKRIQKAHLPTQNYIEKNLNRLQNKG
jgi:tetratricopeptide (TPR) repeat protein